MSTLPQTAAFSASPFIAAPSPSEPRPKRWTREEYNRLAEQGWFQDQRAELIDGEIILLSPQSPQHANASERVRRILDRIFGEKYWVRHQAPIVHGDYSEPEPDICVVRGTIDDFSAEHPTASKLIVEVSYTSLNYDKNTKHSLYASMVVPDFWILDLVHRQLIVHREPRPDTALRFGYGYSSVAVLGEAEQVAPLEKPHALIAVAEMLPPK
jgi:Uma2 family endonuclease